MPSIFQVKTYITYWLDAVSKHSLHSPFLYDLYTRVIHGESLLADFRGLEDIRKQLLSNNQIIPRSNFGAGTQTRSNPTTTIGDIARLSLSPQKFSLLYYRLIRYFQFVQVVELGTSFGISALYLATAGATVTTFEGSPEIASVARNTFQTGNSSTLKLIEGDIDQTLPKYLETVRTIDLAFIDANHRYEPTMRYFKWLQGKTHLRSCIVLDDIHYSEDMEKAWNEIKANKLVYATVDLYRCGLVFFDPSLNKQHVVLQF